MELDFTKKDRTLIVKLRGEIDHHSSEDIRNLIEKEYTRKNMRNIIFDFSEVNFMDSSGIGMIMGRYKRIDSEGGKVAICNVSERVDKIFELSGLYKIIKRFTDITEAQSYIN